MNNKEFNKIREYLKSRNLENLATNYLYQREYNGTFLKQASENMDLFEEFLHGIHHFFLLHGDLCTIVTFSNNDLSFFDVSWAHFHS